MDRLRVKPLPVRVLPVKPRPHPVRNVGRDFDDERGEREPAFLEDVLAPPLALDVPKGVPSWTIEQERKGEGAKVRKHANVLDMVESPEGSYRRRT